eukprot:1157767-Pelagomonas_calceolata.AAC.4
MIIICMRGITTVIRTGASAAWEEARALRCAGKRKKQVWTGTRVLVWEALMGCPQLAHCALCKP